MASTEPVILIDPGHGGSADAGSSTAYGIRLPDGGFEKDRVLQLSLGLAEALGRQGHTVHLTRRDDRNLSLAARASAAALHAPDALISLHLSADRGRVVIHPRASAETLAFGGALGAGLGLPLLRLPMALLGPTTLPADTLGALVELEAQAEPGLVARLGAAVAAGLRARRRPSSELHRPDERLAAVILAGEAPLAQADAAAWSALLPASLGLAPTRLHRREAAQERVASLGALLDRLAAQLPRPASLALVYAGAGLAGPPERPGALSLGGGEAFDPAAWRRQRPDDGLHLWVIADAGFAEAPSPQARCAGRFAAVGGGVSVEPDPPGLSWVCAAAPGGPAWEHPAAGGGLFTAAARTVLREARSTLSAGALVAAIDQQLRQETLRLGLPGPQRPWTSAPDRLLLHPTDRATALPPVRHFVPLVAQQTGMSCWAAGAAMLVGWRDLHPTTDAAVATQARRDEAFRLGLLPSDVSAVAEAFGLVAEPPRAYGVHELWSALLRFGPLWVGEADPELHVVVVAGIEGDGTIDGTHVQVVDPWPVGRGERYTLRFRELMRNYQAASTLAGFEAQLLHCGGRGRR